MNKFKTIKENITERSHDKSDFLFLFTQTQILSTCMEEF
jgi:hypothetical protein